MPESRRGQDPILLNRKRVTEKLRLVRNHLLDDYRLRASACTSSGENYFDQRGPDSAVLRCGGLARGLFRPLRTFLQDVVAVERQMIVNSPRRAAAMSASMDRVTRPTSMAHPSPPCAPAVKNRMATMERSIEADNEVIAGFPGVTFGIHICRGNRQSMWHREGHYDAIAERLFNGLKHQRLLLEYDTERAGGFEPLRFVPKGKIAVLGLITTKVPRLESVDELRRRIDQASRYLPLEQLALSPQCGFASSLRGNLLSEDDQFRKLDVMLETAAKVWG